jgi:Lon protease-like protein
MILASTLDQLLTSFSGTSPLFPLPDFVFFPQTVQPFHIFEDRYLDMIHDAMAGERMVTISLLIEDAEESEGGNPPINRIATLGYISEVHQAEDQHLNILVTGLVKVRLEELESEQPYRRGAITVLTEFSQVTDQEHKRKQILGLFESILDRDQTRGNIEILYGEGIPLAMLTHIIVSALPIPAEEKQKMLELQSLELRIEILLNFLESGLHSLETMGPFEEMLPAQPWWN